MSDRHPVEQIIDVECGPGIYVDEMRAFGLDAIGIDNDERLPQKPWFSRVDVGAHFDGLFYYRRVALSLEVGEHIPEEAAFNYVQFLTGVGAHTIYFSAARPGQGGEGHVNLQPKAYWLRLFCARLYYLDPEATDEWLRYLRSGPHMGWLADPQLGNGMVLRRA